MERTTIIDKSVKKTLLISLYYHFLNLSKEPPETSADESSAVLNCTFTTTTRIQASSYLLINHHGSQNKKFNLYSYSLQQNTVTHQTPI